MAAAMKLKGDFPWEKKKKKTCDKARQHFKKQKHYFTNKGPYSQSYGFFQ